MPAIDTFNATVILPSTGKHIQFRGVEIDINENKNTLAGIPLIGEPQYVPTNDNNILIDFIIYGMKPTPNVEDLLSSNEYCIIYFPEIHQNLIKAICTEVNISHETVASKTIIKFEGKLMNVTYETFIQKLTEELNKELKDQNLIATPNINAPEELTNVPEDFKNIMTEFFKSNAYASLNGEVTNIYSGSTTTKPTEPLTQEKLIESMKKMKEMGLFSFKTTIKEPEKPEEPIKKKLIKRKLTFD